MEHLGQLIARIAILAPPILLAISVHEASHALVAYWRGDPTAKMMGRVTLNPLKHLDPMGTLVFVVSAMAGAGFGWGKPTPVNPRNFKDPRWDDVFISAAGPASNLLTAVVLAIIYNLAYHMGAFQAGAWWLPAIWMLEAGVQVNIILALFNLIPLPPLDGSKILAGFLSPRAEAAYWHYTRHGFLILLALLFLPGLVPGFPDVIHYLLVTPASVLIGILLG